MRGDGCFRGTEVTPMRIVATRSSTSMRPALSAVPSPLVAICSKSKLYAATKKGLNHGFKQFLKRDCGCRVRDVVVVKSGNVERTRKKVFRVAAKR